jgi:hypothetical protein
MKLTKVNSAKQKEVLDSLCLPYMRMPVYKCYNGNLWADDEQLTLLMHDNSFKPEVNNAFLVGVLEFHPLGHDQTYMEIN